MACHLLLVDDHPVLTRGLTALFRQEPDLAVDGQFATGEELLGFLAAAPAPPTQLVLLDLHLPPPHDGLSLLPRLRRDWPRLRVLVFSSAASGMLVAQVAAAGAHGFLDKATDADALLAAIRAVHTGQLVFPASLRRRPDLTASTFPAPFGRGGGGGTERAGAGLPGAVAAEVLLRLRQLSEREREIIGLIREGLSTRAIAEHLCLSELTVGTHRRNLLHKLNLHSVAELLHFVHEHGL